MTQKQINWYWREWAAVHRAAPSTDRHSLHVAALGKDKSMKLLTNKEFDMVLKQFWAISHPESVNHQMRADGQSRVRALHSIRQFPATYVASICADRFGHPDYETLTDDQVFALAMTLDNRRESLEDRELRTAEAVGESLDAEEGCNEPEPAFACQTQSDDPF